MLHDPSHHTPLPLAQEMYRVMFPESLRQDLDAVGAKTIMWSIDNALRYNVTGGLIEVSTSMTAGRASVRVANTGPVIPADQLDRLFQPFQRLGRDRIGHAGGHGLGLAIVRAISRAHAAALTARPRPEGGLDIEVSFP